MYQSTSLHSKLLGLSRGHTISVTFSTYIYKQTSEARYIFCNHIAPSFFLSWVQGELGSWGVGGGGRRRVEASIKGTGDSPMVLTMASWNFNSAALWAWLLPLLSTEILRCLNRLLKPSSTEGPVEPWEMTCVNRQTTEKEVTKWCHKRERRPHLLPDTKLMS